jgi:hypothetical protein
MDQVFILEKSGTIQHAPDGNREEIVLCFLPENTFTPFVTWVQFSSPDGKTVLGRFHGDYHRKLKTALAAFEKRSNDYGSS